MISLDGRWKDISNNEIDIFDELTEETERKSVAYSVQDNSIKFYSENDNKLISNLNIK